MEGGRQGRLQRLGHGRDPSRKLTPRRRGSRATGWCACRTGCRTREAMAIGTAGYTAMLAVAGTGEAGTFAVERFRSWSRAPPAASARSRPRCCQSSANHVIASTGRLSEAPYLKGLGAAEVIDRNELSGPPKPLAKERWAGGIDSVGSTTLANLLSMTQIWRGYRGLRPCCRHGFAVLGGAVYFACRVPSRHRLRDVPDAAARGRLEPARDRFGSGETI